MTLRSLVLLGLCAARLAGADAPARFGVLEVGAAVPEFTVVEAGGAGRKFPDGGAATVTVISFTGANRGPGEALESAFLQYQSLGVSVFTVCTGVTREEFDAWVKKHRSAATHVLAWDPAGKTVADSIARKVFGVRTAPATVVIDRAGTLVGGFVGFGPAAGAVLRDYLRTAGAAIPPDEKPAAAAPPPREDKRLQPGAVAPDFTALDPAGRPVKLSDFAGKIVVLDFWATWCGPCIASMPHSQHVAAATKAQGVVVLAACTSDTRAKFEAWVAENGAKYPDLVFANDPNGRDAPPEKFAGRVSAALYGVSGIPTQFVIGTDGKIVAVITGFGPGDTRLEQALEKLGVKVAPAK